MNEKRLKKFCSTAWERHRIYVLKELGIAKPWTKDPIYLDNFFCNVFRYLDKTSKYIIEEVIKPNEDNSELWKTIIVCRYISRLDTLQQLNKNKLLINNQRALYEYLREMQYDKEKIFTNAFIVNSKTSKGWKDKVTYLFNLIKDVYDEFNCDPDDHFKYTCSMKTMYEDLIQFDGVGPFMAYQYTVDFTYSKHYLKNAADTYEWTALGLGAVRGLNRILTGMPVRTKIPDSVKLSMEILTYWEDEVLWNFTKEVNKTWEIVNSVYPNRGYNNYDTPNYPWLVVAYEPFYNLTLSDCEHWLCEFDKYMRGGSKKRRYYGHA